MFEEAMQARRAMASAGKLGKHHPMSSAGK